MNPENSAEWPDELPEEAADRRDRPTKDPSDPFGLGLSHDAIHGMIGEMQRSWSGFLNTVNAYFRPVRVKLITADSIEQLEANLNVFLDSGEQIHSIGERLHRHGTQFCKEVHYYATPVMIALAIPPPPLGGVPARPLTPHIVTAVIARQSTADGEWQTVEEIGTEHQVDLSRIDLVEGKGCVWLADGSRYIAIDMLDFPVEPLPGYTGLDTAENGEEISGEQSSTPAAED